MANRTRLTYGNDRAKSIQLKTTDTTRQLKRCADFYVKDHFTEGVHGRLSTPLDEMAERAVGADKNQIGWSHRQRSVDKQPENLQGLQRLEVDKTRERQSANDHVYAVSDNNGNILEHYRYTAFGEVETYNAAGQKIAASAIDNTVTWNSRRYDFASGLHYYKYRHYIPRLGRWLGRDPIQEEGGYNLYAFVGNDSVNLWDVYGLATYVLIYDSADSMFVGWKNTVKKKIEGKDKKNTIFGNLINYDPDCDEIVEIDGSNGDPWAELRQYDDIAYIASCGHGNGINLWYNKEGQKSSVVYYFNEKGANKESSYYDYKTYKDIKGSFINDGIVELYHCYAGASLLGNAEDEKNKNSSVRQRLNKIWGVKVFAHDASIANGRVGWCFQCFTDENPVLGDDHMRGDGSGPEPEGKTPGGTGGF